MSDKTTLSRETREYRWHSAKEIFLRNPKDEREASLKNEFAIVGMIAGAVIGGLLIPLLRVLHIHVHIDTVLGIWFLALTGAGYYVGGRIPAIIGDSAAVDLISRIYCTLGRHDFKPDGAFLENGCECVRCHYRPSGKALLKVR